MGLFDLFSSVSRLLERDQASPPGQAGQAGLAGQSETGRCLDQAMAQRCPMAVTFSNRRLADLDFSGPCLLIRQGALVIDAASRPGHASCLGQPVTVYFRLERDGELLFYSFTSQLRGCGQKRGFALDLPTELGSEQRRAFARVSPPEETILFMQGWALQNEELPPPHCFRPAWPVDQARPGKPDVSLVNISAGGLRLKVGREDHELAGCRGKGSRLACFLRLRAAPDGPGAPNPGPENGKVLNLWLGCSVAHSLEQQGLHLGLSCFAWASDEEQPEPTAWNAAGEQGLVPALGGWIWRQQRSRYARYR